MKCFIFTDVVPKICRDNAIKEEAGRTAGTVKLSVMPPYGEQNGIIH
jgi:hypothetical protein